MPYINILLTTVLRMKDMLIFKYFLIPKKTDGLRHNITGDSGIVKRSPQLLSKVGL